MIINDGNYTTITSSFEDAIKKNKVNQVSLFNSNDRLVRYMCTKCFSLTKMYRIYSSFDFNILYGETDTGQDIIDALSESDIPLFETVIAECNNCDNDTWVPIDAPIAEIISNFNKAGLITRFSCSGHVKNDGISVAYILFKDKEFAEKVFSQIPEDDIFWKYWCVNKDNDYIFIIDQVTDFELDKFLQADHIKALEDTAPRLCEIAESLTS